MPFSPLDPSSFHDPTFRVMAAQANNLARIVEGLEVNGASLEGRHTLIGPAPAIIKLHDTPTRLFENQRFLEHDRMFTLAPLLDGPTDRSMGRKGRQIAYIVMGVVQLTRAEQQQDVEEKGADNLLARKADALSWDFRCIFNDNIHLTSDQCPNGLVDDSDFSIEWSQQVTYPRAVFIATVTADLYEFM